MNSTLKMTLGSAVVGFALYGLLVACGGPHAGKAFAQSTDCQQWTYAEISSSHLTRGPDLPTPMFGPEETRITPEGWEFIGLTDGHAAIVRRCVK